MRRLKAVSKYVPVCNPRLLHLDAYFNKIWKKNSRAKDYLKRSMALCDIHGNIQEKNWIHHNQQVSAHCESLKCERFMRLILSQMWGLTIEGQQHPFWSTNSYKKRHRMDWHEQNKTRILYTLPLPHWFMC